MKVTRKAYDPDIDFMRIRDFLIDTFTLYQRPFNPESSNLDPNEYVHLMFFLATI